MKVFLACVAKEFGTCRNVLAADLRALECEVLMLDDSQQGRHAQLAALEADVAQCERVIVLLGTLPEHEIEAEAGGQATGRARSLTRWAYAFARGKRLDGSRVAAKDTYVYSPSARFLERQPCARVLPPAGQQILLAESMRHGTLRGRFNAADHLCRQVLRDGWKLTARPAPAQSRNLSYGSLGPLFKGRAAALQILAIDAHRAQARGACRQVIHGPAGVGKTRLAVEYALSHAEEYNALLYVPAATPEALHHGLGALCGARVLNLPEQQATDDSDRFEAAVRWLGEHPEWLLVLDGADTPAAAAAVEALLARLAGGHVLVTSRRAEWSGAIQARELGVLSEDAALAFVLECTRGERRERRDDEAAARKLARASGGLPLALEQAAAQIAAERLTLREYLKRGRTVDGAPVGAVWEALLAPLDVPAQALLRLLCWLGPAPLPREWLESDAARAALRAGVERLGGAASGAGLEPALAALAGASLVQWESDGGGLCLRPLVLRHVRENLAADERDTSLRAVLEVMHAWLPGIEGAGDSLAWVRWEALRTHVVVLVQRADEAGITWPTLRLMNDLGALLSYGEPTPEAESLLRRARRLGETSACADRTDLIANLHILALLLQATQCADESEEVLRRAVELCEESPERQSPQCAAVLATLAQWLHATERAAEAEPLLRRAVALAEGSVRSSVYLAALADLLEATDRGVEAEPLRRDALAVAEAISGGYDMHAAVRVAELAHGLEAMNRWSEAEPLRRRAVAIVEGCSGEGDGDVAVYVAELAHVLETTERWGEAEPLRRRALAIAESHSGGESDAGGEGDIHVAVRLVELARCLEATGRWTEAEPLRRRVVEITKAGTEGPQDARGVEELGALLEAHGRLDEAEPHLRRALEILLHLRQATGQEPPELAPLVSRYSSLLRKLGHTEREVRLRLDAITACFGAPAVAGQRQRPRATKRPGRRRRSGG